MKQRLIESLTKANQELKNIPEINEATICSLANYLEKDGWIKPPCKVGDIFYGVNETEYDDYEVLGFKWGKRRGDDEYVLLVLTVYDMEFEWGEEAFLTKEEAEAKLNERKGEGK